MPKYYMYDIATNSPERRVVAAIIDPAIFAAHAFDPNTMSFSGISVFAENEEEARRVFETLNGEFYSEDEPEPTARMRSTQESVDHVDNVIAAAISKIIAKNLNDLNKYICMMANALHTNNPEVPPEEFYKKLRDTIIKGYMRVHKYNG
jgi:hypothetical protein